MAVGDDGRALYFSRATIPWHREAFAAGDGGFVVGEGLPGAIGVLEFTLLHPPGGRLQGFQDSDGGPAELVFELVGNARESPAIGSEVVLVIAGRVRAGLEGIDQVVGQEVIETRVESDFVDEGQAPGTGGFVEGLHLL